MGSAAFGVPIITRLLEDEHHLVCVYTQPPRPAGRGKRERLSPVHTFANINELKVRTPNNFCEHEIEKFVSFGADIAIVVAYGLILPKSIIKIPKFGCINVHASLLPRWRGAAPIQRAIAAGDKRTGISIIQMDESLDTGPIICKKEIYIPSIITTSVLYGKLSNVGAGLIPKVLEKLSNGDAKFTRQPTIGVSYAKKLIKNEGKINWRNSAVDIERKVRALNPWPGVWFELLNERIKVFEGEVIFNNQLKNEEAGTVVDDNLGIFCGSGIFRPTSLQRPGRKVINLERFLRGYKIAKGTLLS